MNRTKQRPPQPDLLEALSEPFHLDAVSLDVDVRVGIGPLAKSTRRTLRQAGSSLTASSAGREAPQLRRKPAVVITDCYRFFD
jgi:hypothetical protein